MRAEASVTWLSAILVSVTWPSAILVLGTASSAVQPKCVDRVREIGSTKLDLPGPVTCVDAVVACRKHSNMGLLRPDTRLTLVVKALCGDQLVPLASDDDWQSDAILLEDDSANDETTTNRAANFSSGTWRYVSDSYEYACVLCQHRDVTYPLITLAYYDDITASKLFVAHLTEVGTRDTAEVSEDVKDRLSEELDELLKTDWGPSSFDFHRAWLDESKHLHIDFTVESHLSVTVTTGNASTSWLNGSFEARVEDVGWCPAGETVDADGAVTLWPTTALNDDFRFITNLTTGAITRRDCSFNWDTFRSEWDPLLSRWELVWTNCTSAEQYANEEDYKPVLDGVDVDLRHATALQELAATPVNATTLQEVARLVDRNVKGCNELNELMVSHIVNISAHHAMDPHSDHSVATTGRVDQIVADLGGSDPVLGFTLECDLFESHSLDNVTLNRKPTVEGRALFAMDVSPRLAEAHSRLAFVVVWKYIPFYANEGVYIKLYQYVEVTVMFPRKGEVSRWAFASYGNHHVEITYDRCTLLEYDRDYGYLVCVAWNNDLRDWTAEGCKTLDKGNFSACRCSGKYFALQDGVPIAKYALRKGFAKDISVLQNNIYTDFLKDKVALMTATAFECLLSLLGMASIIATAILFKRWRENAGHKILLHMVLALTCNLVLGFIANFAGMHTESVTCLIYGVLRHYSFLAMFFWMLALSLLQMKRLMTVAGSKATTHLILKVAVFAWGVPLVPIVILLCVNPGFYQTDRFERGYCYPEGLVFQVTVQAPAGLILLVNLGIFINIMLHIFESVGEKKVTRHSKNEKAEQLNKLKTSLFIFFLFGFSWVFHILSEERVIVSDFLFEYLFLMTATTHIFVLALFFVVFQESTRKDWVDWIRKKTGKR